MIPKELIAELGTDPFYKQCCLCGHSPVQWHHNLLYAGKSVEERFAILPLCKNHHDMVTPHKPEFEQITLDRVDWIMLNRATDEELNKYSKVEDLFAKKKALSKKYE